MFNTAILHYSAPPVIGGVEAVILAHARLFVDNGYPVTVIAGQGDAESLPEGCDLICIPEIDSQHPEILKASAALEQGNIPDNFDHLVEQITAVLRPVVRAYDNVIIHNVLTKHFNLPLTAALFRLLDSGDIKHAIAWCHDFTWTSVNSGHKVHPGYPWDLLRTYRDDLTYVVVSIERQQILSDLLGCPRDRIRVVYNGADPSVLFGLSAAGKALLERSDLLNSDLNILMPVRVTQAKNIEYALEVVAALKEKGIRPKLIVTGPPDPHDPDSMMYFNELRELRHRLGVDHEMRFVFELGDDPSEPCIITMDVVSELFRLADLMFMPSHREGFGMPVLEAGLLGIPVFSTHIPASDEIGRDDIDLFDVEEGPEQTAARIYDRLMQDPIFRFRRRSRKEYTWDVIFREAIVPLLMKAGK